MLLLILWGGYKELLSGNTFGDDKHFSRAYSPLYSKSHLENVDYAIDRNGISLLSSRFKALYEVYECTSKLRRGVTRYKFICPKMKWIYDKSSQKLTDNVIVKIPVLLHQNAFAWFISIQKRVCVHI